jgi:polyphosphate kinase
MSGSPRSGGPQALAGPAVHHFERDLSWLAFNERVLSLAADPAIPLLERCKFCAIASTNLDEFFQIRVAGRVDAVVQGRPSSYGSLTPRELLRRIGIDVRRLIETQARLVEHELLPTLAANGVAVVSAEVLDRRQNKLVDAIFEAQIFPVLTPLAVDPGHPFPYISTLSLNLAVLLRDPVTGAPRFARVKVPPLFPRFVSIDEGKTLVTLESVISSRLDRLFLGMEVEGSTLFRVTRDADLDVDDEESDDMLRAVESELRRRRFGRAVRLEVSDATDAETVDVLCRELELDIEHVYFVPTLIDLSALHQLHQLELPDLKDKPWTGGDHSAFAADGETLPDVFAEIRAHDILVHHPYDSFATSVERFILSAALDPKVLAIKQTLYRTSGDSPIIKALIKAAESGKQVAALIELKARFDEQANIEWARALERAGVHVVYGLVGLKTHSKTALVVRAESDGLRRYVHVGTGNYHSTTARFYEDLGFFTTDAEITADIADLFNSLTGYARSPEYRQLLVAPINYRQEILRHIKAQAKLGADGYVWLKLNSLVDPEIIDALYHASKKGVPVEILVRGICCLRPGLQGVSDSITVRSILGRYLEHSRVFCFGRGDEATWVLGSADLMPRNLNRRVEVGVAVKDPALRRQLDTMRESYMAADVKHWQLGTDGTWRQHGTTDVQETLYRASTVSRK